MTKKNLFLLTILSILGGFILCASSSAFAADKKDKKDDTNTNVESVLEEFKRQKLILSVQKKSDGKRYTVSEKLAKAKTTADKSHSVFIAKAEELRDKCKTTYLEFLEQDLKAAKAKAEKAKQQWKEGDYWDAIGNGLGAGLKARFSIVTAGIKWGKAEIENELTKLGQSIINELWSGGFAYTSQAEAIKNYCELVKKPLTAKEYENLMALGVQAEADRGVYKGYRDLELDDKEIWTYKYCTKKDKNGKCESYGYLDFVIDTDNNTAKSVDGASQGCIPLPFKLYETRSCLFCPMFTTIFNAVQNASSAAYNKLAKPLSTILMIGLSIWISLMVLSNVSAMTKQDAPAFLTNLFKNSFKVVIIFFMLRYSSIVYDIIVGPLLSAGFEFGTSFLNRSAGTLKGCTKALSEIKRGTSGVLPQYVYGNLLCFIKAVQYELATSQAIGSSLMCVARNAATGALGPFANVMPDFSMMLQGALVYIISFILSLAFGFYLIDATVSLGIFGVLLPLLLTCYPFKITNGYFKKGVEVFMNSWFVYVFMGIVVNISLQLIGQGLTGGKGGFDEIEAAINGNDVKTLQSLLSIGFSGFLILVACCIFGVKLMMKVQELAGTFAGGGLNLGIGNKIGGLAAASATNLTKAGIGATASIASSAYNAKLWKGEDGKYHSAADGVNKVKTKAARFVAGGVQSGAHAVGHAIATPFKAMANLISGSKRRNPNP